VVRIGAGRGEGINYFLAAAVWKADTLTGEKRKITMCEFISFYVGWKGEIYVGDCQSHSSAEEFHQLGDALKSKHPPVPVEWTADDAGSSIAVRVPSEINRDESWYKALILSLAPTRQNFLQYILREKKYGGWLNLGGCTGLTSLPEGLHVGGGLDLSGCTGLTSLPEGLHVGEWLDLRGCTGLTSLPKGLHVGDGLNLGGCTGLTSLPGGLHVGGWLYLRGCTGLTSLPKGLHVGGSLDLNGCTGLTSLPKGLHVGEWLNLNGCTGLTSLPEGLNVGGWLNLNGCTGLTSLPEGLHVGEWLYLNGCNKILIADADKKVFRFIC
jgi:hypothetical protein